MLSRSIRSILRPTVTRQLQLQRAFATRTKRVGTNAEGQKQDKLLFTPGPLSTSYTVKQAMQRDLGSRDVEFISTIKEIRSGVLKLAGVPESEFTMIPVQGSGTFGVEAVVSSVVPTPDKGGLLLAANGAYGMRIGKMAAVHKMKHKILEYGDDVSVPVADVDRALTEDKSLTHVAVVHSETTSGIINDIHAIGKVVKKHNRSFIVDAMSSFGALPISFQDANIDFLITSANKCIQGVPGFAFIVARKSTLAATKGNARTLSLDIHDQVIGLDKDGQFRFTPPTHAILAFRQALKELEEEGGVEGRRKRYQENHDVLDRGMKAMGFKSYLDPKDQGPIISTYKYPNDPNWSFEKFYSKLNARGLVIYPGKVTKNDCFRMGHIGHMFPEDSERLLAAVKEVCAEMGVDPRK